MSIQSQLNEILTIKNEMKAILTNLGVITSTTRFQEYAEIIKTLQVKS
jgi:hypothetical protein